MKFLLNPSKFTKFSFANAMSTERLFCNLIRREVPNMITESEYKTILREKRQLHLLRLGTPDIIIGKLEICTRNIILNSNCKSIYNFSSQNPIRFIEFKSYFGLERKYSQYNLHLQIDRYNKNFGFGLFVCNNGFDERFENLILRNHDITVLGVNFATDS